VIVPIEPLQLLQKLRTRRVQDVIVMDVEVFVKNPGKRRD
jgi:hypothetical protein